MTTGRVLETRSQTPQCPVCGGVFVRDEQVHAECLRCRRRLSLLEVADGC